MTTKKKSTLFLAALVILLATQVQRELNMSPSSEHLTLSDWFWNLTYVKNSSPDIEDNPALYKDETTKVSKLYVVILPTVDRMNTGVKSRSLKAYVVNPDGNDMPEDGRVKPNASITISLSGNSAIQSGEKSYEIRLSQGQLGGSSTLNLNKYPFDPYKVRNKIAFELMDSIPDLLRTRIDLVNLHMKDLTDNMDEGFVDYGLFTNVEQVDRAYFEKRNLNPNGTLYRAKDFKFLRYPTVIRNTYDSEYDANVFGDILEPKIVTNHNQLIEMLDDVNNYNLDINKVLDKHFNRDNYFTWLAVNILMGNNDAKTQNLYLYNPGSTWYFISPNDTGVLERQVDDFDDQNVELISFIGIPNYWDNTLHSRVFREPNNLRELNRKIEYIYSLLPEEKIRQTAEKYLPIVESEYNRSLMDQNQVDREILDRQIEEIGNTVKSNRAHYYAYMERPMPMHLGDVTKSEERHHFSWGESFDLQGDKIYYKFQISSKPDFSEIIYEMDRLLDTELELNLRLKSGEYFWKVIVIDSKGNMQRAFDSLDYKDGTKYVGLKNFEVGEKSQ